MNYTELFDIDRAIIRPEPICVPLYEAQAVPIKTIQSLPKNIPVVVAQVKDVQLVFHTLHLSYYHVVQGKINGQHWMVSFCLICNAGNCFAPVLNSTTYHFAERGLYNAMTLLADNETGSFWNHITGECLHGTLQGQKLERLSTLQHMTFGQVQTAYSDAQFVVSQLTEEQQAIADDGEQFRTAPQPELPAQVLATMRKEDTRLPRLEAGLGIWAAKEARFYPFTQLNAHNNVVIDKFEDHNLLVYVDPQTSIPNAIYTSAIQGQWRGDDLHLNTGEIIRQGVPYSKAQERLQLDRPLQLFQRWYSFAFNHPDCSIYNV